MRVLGLDPGLKNFGWAVLDLEAHAEGLVALGVIRTAKAKGKGVLVTDDLHRRGQELARELVDVLDLYPVACACAESISYPRNASVSAQLGRAWGVIDTLLEQRKLALLSASPKAIKKACTGLASASKEGVLDALDARYGGRVRQLLRPIKAKTLHEHPVDAIGAVVASLEHDHLRLARAVAAQRQPELPNTAPRAQGGIA